MGFLGAGAAAALLKDRRIIVGRIFTDFTEGSGGAFGLLRIHLYSTVKCYYMKWRISDYEDHRFYQVCRCQ